MMEFEEWWETIVDRINNNLGEEIDIVKEAYQAGQADQREKDARIAEDMQCEADGYHVCLHNESIAKAIREAE